jgi:hypothetical protein
MTNIKKNDVTPTNVVETVLTASEKLRMARAAAAAKIAAAKAAEAELIALEAELGLTAAVEDVTDKIAGAANMEDLKTVLFTAIRDLFPDACKSFTAIQAQFPEITFIAPKTPRKPKAPKADGDAAAGEVKVTVADKVYAAIDAAGTAGINKAGIVAATGVNENTLGRILRPTELRDGYTVTGENGHKLYFAPTK